MTGRHSFHWFPVTAAVSVWWSSAEGLELLFSGPGVSATYRNVWPGWYNVGGYVLDDTGVMLSGYDGKREAYDTARLLGVRFEDTAGGFLEFDLLEEFRNRTLLQIVNTCMGADRHNDGSFVWRMGHCVAGRLSSTFGVPRPAAHLRIGFAGPFNEERNWVLFRLQDYSARSEFTYAFATQNKTNPGFAGRVYIHGVQHAVESFEMWKSVSRPCAIDKNGCITSHNYPRFYGSQEHCSLEIEETMTGPLVVTDFETEKNHDILTVNGKAYSGNEGPQGIVPYGQIIWRSDHSISKRGWRLCPQPGTTPPPRRAPLQLPAPQNPEDHPNGLLVALPAILLTAICVMCYCAPTHRKALRRWSSAPSARVRDDIDQEHHVCGSLDTVADEEEHSLHEGALASSEIREGLLERNEENIDSKESLPDT